MAFAFLADGLQSLNLLDVSLTNQELTVSCGFLALNALLTLWCAGLSKAPACCVIRRALRGLPVLCTLLTAACQ